MRSAAAIALFALVSSATGRAYAGAAEQSCNLDKVQVDDLTFELKQPRHCPPGDLVVRGPGQSIVLERALWLAGFGKRRLPAVVDNHIIWLQAEGQHALLRATRLPGGETTTLGSGGFVPDHAVRSGRYLAVGESKDPLPDDIRHAIPQRLVFIDLQSKDHPALLPATAQMAWPAADLALEHVFEVSDAPGTFWFLLSGLSPTRPDFRIGRYRDGATQFAVFEGPEYRSYAYLRIDPVCGLVAWNACDALRDAKSCRILLRGLGAEKGTTIPLHDDGYVGELFGLTPDGLTYAWTSHKTYASEKRTRKFAARCKP